MPLKQDVILHSTSIEASPVCHMRIPGSWQMQGRFIWWPSKSKGHFLLPRYWFKVLKEQDTQNSRTVHSFILSSLWEVSLLNHAYSYNKYWDLFIQKDQLVVAEPRHSGNPISAFNFYSSQVQHFLSFNVWIIAHSELSGADFGKNHTDSVRSI